MSLLTTFLSFCAISCVAASMKRAGLTEMKATAVLQTFFEKNDHNGRITNGEIAESKQFPYQTGLLFYTAGGEIWCGGSIISERWIIRAGHCIEEILDSVDVYVGALNRTDASEKGQHKIFLSSKYVFVHENYDSVEIENDIAVIKLPVPLEFTVICTKYIQPVKLPQRAVSGETFENQAAIASGWGILADGDDQKPDVLQWIIVPVISNSECTFRIFGSIRSTNICIGTEDFKSTCHGDAGGPLVLVEDTTLIGVASFNIIYSCEIGGPAVFSRVTSYLDWIAANTGIEIV